MLLYVLSLLFIIPFLVFATISAPTPLLQLTSSIAASPSVRLSPQPPIPFLTTPPPASTPTLSVDLSQRFQSLLLGFGGAFTQSAGSQFALLSPALRAELIRAYFHPTEGHAYNIGRVPIGSCDYSEFSYSYDDSVDDFNLTHFDRTAKVDSASIIPLIQAAQAAGGERLMLYAAPWSPPAWMKQSGQMNGSSTPCLKDDPRVYRAWAQYFVEWFTVYQKRNISFWGLSIQNEPLFSPPWEGCIFSAQGQLDFFVQYLHPALSATFPHLQVMAWDFNKGSSLPWINTQFGNSSGYDLFWGTSLHWYDGLLPDAMDALHEAWPNKPLLATEACICPGVRLDDWSRGEQYSRDIIGNLNHWAVGWTDWNLLLNDKGGPTHVGESCDSAVIARFDLSPVVLHYQPMYWALGHFSRFLPRHSQRVYHRLSQTTSLQAGVKFATLAVAAHSIHTAVFPAALLTFASVAANE